MSVPKILKPKMTNNAKVTLLWALSCIDHQHMRAMMLEYMPDEMEEYRGDAWGVWHMWSEDKLDYTDAEFANTFNEFLLGLSKL